MADRIADGQPVQVFVKRAWQDGTIVGANLIGVRHPGWIYTVAVDGHLVHLASAFVRPQGA